MKFVWPLLLVFFRSIYLVYSIWCLLFPLALLCLLGALWTDTWTVHHYRPEVTWAMRAVFGTFGLVVLVLVLIRRAPDDPNPFQSAFMSWFGTLRWFWNTQPAARVALGLPSGHLVENPGGYRTTGRHQREILGLLQPGDILLRGFRGYVDGALIRLSSPCTDQGFQPGWFSHVALYVGALDEDDKRHVPPLFADNPGYFEQGPQMVVHAMAKGVHTEDILTFCRCDYLAVLRIKADAQALKTAKVCALEKIGRQYDFDCSDTTRFHRFSCAELLYYCYRDICTNLGLQPRLHALYPLGAMLRKFAILKRTTLTPDDYYDLVAHGSVECVWEDSASAQHHARLPATP